MRKHLSASESQSRDSIVPPRAADKTSFASNVVLKHRFTCNVRNLERPSRHRGRQALIGCRVLRPSGSVPIAGPSTSSPKHTSNNKCAWRLSSPCGYLPAARRLRARSSVVGWLKPTNQLGIVLIPEVRARLSPVSSNCSRATCRFQRFSVQHLRLERWIRPDRVSG